MIPLPRARTPIACEAADKPDIKVVRVQTAQPLGNDPGAITVSYCSVQDDVVVVRDEDGRPTGKRQKLVVGKTSTGWPGGWPVRLL